MQSIPARLQAQTQLPDLGGLALGYNVFRWPHACLLVARGDDHVSVYDLRDAALNGAAPLARVATPVPSHRPVAPSPDAGFVVVCDQRELRAVNADGSLRWRLAHPCWGCADELDHSVAPPCKGIDGGSAYVSADGALVWAHIVSAWDEETESGEQWLVLDAADGTILGSAGLGGGTAGSGHLLHPDGRHAVLSIGFGQDGASTHLGTWDGTQLTVRDFDSDRVAVDLDPSGQLLVSTPHSDDDLVLHGVPEMNRLVQLPAPDMPHGRDVDSASWDYVAGFVDADTVIAVLDTRDTHSTHGTGTFRDHWLLDTHRGPIGPVAYPTGATADLTSLTALGDGTWATIDTADTLSLWQLDERRPG